MNASSAVAAELTPLERKHIVVVPDMVIDADRQLHRRCSEAGKGDSRPWPWAKFESKKRDRVLNAIAEVHEDGVDVRPVSASQARDFTLPVGHPLPATVYVADPASDTRYYPAADFHRRVFEHKFAEAVRLVMSLGAIDFRVEWERGWKRDLAADVEGTVKKIVGAHGDANSDHSRRQTLLFEGHMMPGPAHVPEDLVWFHHEPTWRAMADSRVRHDLRQLSLTVRSSEDYNVTTEVVGKLRRRKLLGLGGEFTQHRDTSWRIEATFGAPPEVRPKHWWEVAGAS